MRKGVLSSTTSQGFMNKGSSVAVLNSRSVKEEPRSPRRGLDLVQVHDSRRTLP